MEIDSKDYFNLKIKINIKINYQIMESFETESLLRNIPFTDLLKKGLATFLYTNNLKDGKYLAEYAKKDNIPLKRLYNCSNFDTGLTDINIETNLRQETLNKFIIYAHNSGVDEHDAITMALHKFKEVNDAFNNNNHVGVFTKENKPVSELKIY